MRWRYDHGPDLNPTQHCYTIIPFIHSFIHSSPGLDLPLCCASRSFALGQGPTGGVWGCVCVCLSINNNLRMQLHSNNNLFYPFPNLSPIQIIRLAGGPIGGARWTGILLPFFSLSAPPPSSLRRFGCSFELDSCQELSWQLSKGQSKKRKESIPGT